MRMQVLRVSIPFSPVYWNLDQGRQFIRSCKTRKAAYAAAALALEG